VLLVAPAVIAESRPERRVRLDLPGAVTVTLGLLAIVFGLSSAAERSWTSPLTLGSLALGVVLLVVFWQVEKKVADPLVPVAILRRGTVAWGNFAGLLAFITETSLVFLLTLYLHKVLGFTPLAAGLSFAVLGIGTVIGGIAAPRLIGRLGPKRAIVTGFAVQTAATLPLVLLGPSSAWMPLLLVATFTGGVANLIAIVGFMVTATSGLPDAEQGLATGLATMSQQIGITMGIPIMSAIAAAQVHALGGETPSTVLTGVTTAIRVNAVLCVAAGVLVALFLKTRSAERVS
jgi:predicted MFS family arabinose efflux permease